MTAKKVDDAYAYGFVTKCAEAGVDPEELVKLAQADDSRLLAYLTNFMPFGSALYGATRAPEGERLGQAIKTQLAGTGARLGGAGVGLGAGSLLGAGLGAGLGSLLGSGGRRRGALLGAGIGGGIGGGIGAPLGETIGGGEATYRAGYSPDRIERIKNKLQEVYEDITERFD